MMYNSKILRVLCSLVLIVCFLSSCGNKSTAPAQVQSKTPPILSEKNESVPPVETPSQDQISETLESDTEQEFYLAAYIGKTVGDVSRELGEEYTVDYYEGSTMIGYPENLWFLFGGSIDKITADLVVRQMIASGDRPAVYGLTGSMTYPEIVETVGEEVEIPPPNRHYSELDECWEITTGFPYRGYSLIYTWLEDPEKTASSFVHVLKLDIDSLAPSGAATGYNSAVIPDNADGSSDSQELFHSPGWFEGVLGSKFYVPSGFTQEAYEKTARMPGMYTYSFHNDELNMSISVFECTFAALPVEIDVSDMYQTASTSEGVTYATSGNGYYVVSGYSSDNAIFYSRVDYDEASYTSLDFEYSVNNADACEKTLLGFLEKYSAG